MSKKIKPFISSLFMAVLLLSISAAVDMAKEKFDFSCGKLVTQYLDVSEFERENIIKTDYDYLSRDNDPQLWYVVDCNVSGVKFYMESALPTGEVLVYYTTSRDQSFGGSRHGWAVPVKGEENRYRLTIPVQYVHTLRLDPSVNAGNRFVFGDFILNPQRTFSQFFPVNYKTVTTTIVFAALLWTISRFIMELFEFFVKKGYKKK